MVFPLWKYALPSSLLHAALLLTPAFPFRKQTAAWCPSFQVEQKQPAALAGMEQWHGRREQGEALLSPLAAEHKASSLFPALLLCTEVTSDPFGSDTVNLKTSDSVSSGPLLPQLSVVSNVTVFSKTFCPRSCNDYVIVTDLSFPGFLWNREVIFSALSCRGNWGTG